MSATVTTVAPSRIGGRRLLRKVVLAWVGLFVLVACLTILFLCARSVMAMGGSCASGGPYAIARPCPQGVGWMLPASIWVGLVAICVYVAGEVGLPGPSWAVLAWPALFLSLGWNFWEFGLESGSADNIGFIICGVLFVLMGGGPLVAILRSKQMRRDLFWADREPDPPARPTRQQVAERARPKPKQQQPQQRRRSMVDELERLTALHRSGALDADEFERAKESVIRRGG